MTKRLLIPAFIFNIVIQSALAVEGIWIPLLIEKYNIKDMHEKGCSLTAEDIYSINQDCLTNTVVLFGRGCTGEVISQDGLVLTNYHCGNSRIQSHSTMEKNYLKDGFWAGSNSEELPNSGLTVTFLVRIEDVTQKVVEDTEDMISWADRKNKINGNIQKLINETTAGTNYDAEVKPFFYGKEYYMFVYQIFRDIRLVGAPPRSIGEFGLYKDNWIWPRHCADFSLFRIYADSSNNPADYSPANIPYKPKNHLKLSIKGIRENDFTMILGYPARTHEYLTSHEVKIIGNRTLPLKIELRNNILTIMRKGMDKKPETDLKYTKKYFNVANACKKWIGVVQGFDRFGTIEKKEAFEAKFKQWLNNNPDYQQKYGYLLPEFTKVYQELEPYYVINEYAIETISGIELLEFISGFTALFGLNTADQNDEFQKTILTLKSKTVYFFRNYDVDIDREVFIKLLELYDINTDKRFHPEIYDIIHSKYKGNYEKFVDHILGKTLFLNKDNILKMLENYTFNTLKKIISDPAFKVLSSFGELVSNVVYPHYQELTGQLESLYPEYLTALMIMQPDKLFYPDANFTMRMTYGKVEGYTPADAIEYKYATSLAGMMEKENPEIYDYYVPDKLKQLYREKDFGSYGENGKMPLCFVASNHTSGGNSGSPVLNADGELIGLNFDRNWEGTMNDFMYDPDICRNISVDIRYVLFIIEKYAGAYHIIDELTIVN